MDHEMHYKLDQYKAAGAKRGWPNKSLSMNYSKRLYLYEAISKKSSDYFCLADRSRQMKRATEFHQKKCQISELIL